MKINYFFLLSFIILVLTNIGGIGYFLYLWGAEGLAFGLAAWSAFKLWIIWEISGLSVFVYGFFLEIKKGLN